MPRRNGFTLVELLVVISIIVILVSILVPGMERAMASSQRAKCITNLSAIGKAIGTYLNDSISRNYPRTSTEYALLGKRGEPYDPPNNNPHTGAAFDSDKRPLNRYLGITSPGSEVKVAQCPSDAGDATIDPDGETTDGGTTTTSNDPSGTGLLTPVFGTTTNNPDQNTMSAGKVSSVYKLQGNSYASAMLSNQIDKKPYFKGVQSAFNPAMQAASAKPAASKILLGDSPWPGNRAWATDRKHRWHSADKTKRQHNILLADYHAEFFEFKKDPADASKFEIETNPENAQPQPGRGYW